MVYAICHALVRRSCNWSSIEVAAFIPFQSLDFSEFFSPSSLPSVGVDKSHRCLSVCLSVVDVGLIVEYATRGLSVLGDG